ncbi:hypothetical protein N7468_005941 [Penicillium chermesinum]|uniref:T6SS Phospholipase effector Tle1-like catalytic domain-containing protein n=1 Tax=Penicillium chermesinum TaxID=63820 RepID=A0A9W9P0D8_9EURO|nr:uncharacterized protein N7468_005941 [Penicillium chermesinum]KAJ5232985.1 hypothetical protein N7468_005941 [Penicillium chermesinum]
MSYAAKRIIACMDGTWTNSDYGYTRPTLDERNATIQVPTNVTRLYRALRKRGLGDTSQVLYYHPGVGSSGELVDTLEGGVFGAGVSENVRETYDFIVSNYEPGDEIILVGFSRGAFTARAVAGLITDIGLLNTKGMEYFYAIFEDVQNWKNPHYKDKFPTVPFPDKPSTPTRGNEYRRRLEENKLTRLYDPEGYRIKVRCVAVWETVGSLGIPDTNLSNRLHFYDTSLSNEIEYAFQALALDETRTSFVPTLWHRPSHVHTHLRQVWFPGAHSNVGGGMPDQEIANITMAWMMDQLASIGVSFENGIIEKIFTENVLYYYHARPKALTPTKAQRTKTDGPRVYRLAGKTTRTPGMYRRIDPDTGDPTHQFLKRTNESIHRSVRIRLALEGLGYDDVGLYKCRALLRKGPWELERMRVVSERLVRDASDGAERIEEYEESRWGWVYSGPEKDTPPETIMMEEPLGTYEQKLLHMNKGRGYYKSIVAEAGLL